LDEINAAGQMPVTANSRLNPNLLRQRTCSGRNLRETCKKVVDTVRHHSQTRPTERHQRSILDVITRCVIIIGHYLEKRHTEHESGLKKHSFVIEGVLAWIFQQRRLRFRYEKHNDMPSSFPVHRRHHDLLEQA